MSTIDIRHRHTFSAADSRPRIAQFEETLQKYGARLDWRGNVAEIKGTGVSGDVRLEDKQVSITVKLGMLAKAVGIDAARLEASIRKRIEAAFAETPKT
jgi:putative polyhydroxyalkanoate system protein